MTFNKSESSTVRKLVRYETDRLTGRRRSVWIDEGPGSPAKSSKDRGAAAGVSMAEAEKYHMTASGSGRTQGVARLPLGPKNQ